MLRTISSCEKNVEALPPIVLAVGAASSTIVADRTTTPDETSAITVQNVGNNNIYYNFQGTADAVSNFHGILQPGIMLNCPGTMAVNAISPLGSTVCVCIFVRVQGL